MTLDNLKVIRKYIADKHEQKGQEEYICCIDIPR